MANYVRALELEDDTVEAVGSQFISDVLDAKILEAEVLIEKQQAYGPHNIGRPPHGITPQTALAVRINDKVQRLGTLIAADVEQPAGSEARADTWLDVANYGTIGGLVDSGRWPGLRPDPAPQVELDGLRPDQEAAADDRLWINRAMLGNLDLSRFD